MHDPQQRDAPAGFRAGVEATPDGMWRWLDYLPVRPPILYPLPVGGTPLVAPPALREELGLDLWLKDETRGPTASNKDRATALVIQQALWDQAQGTAGEAPGRLSAADEAPRRPAPAGAVPRRPAGAVPGGAAPVTVSCASTGNVAVSLAVGAAAAGLRAVIFVPAQVDPHKLAIMRFAGATVVKVREGYTAAFRLSRQAAEAFGWYDRNTGVNPLTVEGKKTVAFEIWEQLGGAMPDAVVAPVGDGVTLAALDRGFRELAARLAPRSGLPRIIGVQAAGADPVRRAWLAGTDRIEPMDPQTIADGIAVGAPIYGPEALAAVRSSDGGFTAVTDDELLGAMARLASRAGLLAEPAGAGAFAGVIRALEEGLIQPGERVVALVTGSALKTPGLVAAALREAPRAGAVVEVPADLDALKEALDALP